MMKAPSDEDQLAKNEDLQAALMELYLRTI